MQRDVRVTLGAARPAWLAAAMDHRADGTTRELLEQMGVVDDPAYRLLDMLDAAPSPHRHLVEPLPDAPWRGGETPAGSTRDPRGRQRADRERRGSS